MGSKPKENSALQVEWRSLDSIRPYPKNARKISQKAIDSVAKSITEFGWRQPIVVDVHGVIVIGHVRRLAAIQLTMLQVPVHVCDLPDSKIRALRLMDNRSHDEAQWDMEVLTAEMLELRGLDLDLGLTGFASRELDALMRVDRSDEDDVPDVSEAVVTKPGDLWLMGNHRLLCGDALDDWHGDVMLTDPPYGVGVQYESFTDNPDNVALLIPRIMRAISRCGVALLTPGVPCMWMYPQPSWLLCWVHPAPSGGCPWGFAGVNPILAYGNDPYLKAGMGRRPDSVVMATDRQGVEGHPTPKPMAVWKWLLDRSSVSKDDVIFDPFLGSGTTLIAAEQLGRACHGAEIEPKYCDVIVRRWQKFTGREATLGGSGATFEHVKDGRFLEWQDAIKEEVLGR